MSLFNAAARNDLPPITLIAVHDFADTDGVTRYDIFIEASNPNAGGCMRQVMKPSKARCGEAQKTATAAASAELASRPQRAVNIYHDDADHDGDGAVRMNDSGGNADSVTDDELSCRPLARSARYNEFASCTGWRCDAAAPQCAPCASQRQPA